MLQKQIANLSAWILLTLAPSFGSAAPRSSDTPGIVPFQETRSANEGSRVGLSTLGVEMYRAVPDGMLLVVQHASVSIETNNPDLDAHCSVFGGNADDAFGRVTPDLALVLGPQYRLNGVVPGRIYGRSASQPVSLYIDSGLAAEIACFFSREIGAADKLFLRGSVTGYLIPN